MTQYVAAVPLYLWGSMGDMIYSVRGHWWLAFSSFYHASRISWTQQRMSNTTVVTVVLSSQRSDVEAILSSTSIYMFPSLKGSLMYYMINLLILLDNFSLLR